MSLEYYQHMDQFLREKTISDMYEYIMEKYHNTDDKEYILDHLRVDPIDLINHKWLVETEDLDKIQDYIWSIINKYLLEKLKENGIISNELV